MTGPEQCQLCQLWPSGHVIWMLTAPCPDFGNLFAGRGDDLTKQEMLEMYFGHLHSCERHFHVHLCERCWDAGEDVLEGVAVGEDGMLYADGDAAARYDHHH
jgi:hypothetical protein